MDVTSRLKEIVGEANVLTGRDDLNDYGQDRTRFAEPAPLCIVKPGTTEEVTNLVKLARTEKLALVPSGGRTGLSGGACATHGEIIVSFDRMNAIRDFNAADGAVTVEAGVITSNLQQFAEDNNLFYPVDFASSGSSQIGGNIATNAGGIRVLRYGMTRDQVTGLRVVTGRGEVMDLNRGLIKNNTGYDLRHLFIGSEGTLGFIVEATIKLISPPDPARVILLALPRMVDCITVLQHFRETLSLNAFEFFSDNALEYVTVSRELPRPFEEPSNFYVLIECECGTEADEELILAAFSVCMEQGLITDGVISSSEQQNQSLWQYREGISEAIAPKTPYKNDIAVKVSNVPELLAQVNGLVNVAYPDFEIVWFGHIGDGNLHLNILKPDKMPVEAFKAECESVSKQVLSLVNDFGGSISAEHGIGRLKRDQLHYSRSHEEIDALKAIKAVFDPDGIMNPGKLII